MPPRGPLARIRANLHCLYCGSHLRPSTWRWSRIQKRYVCLRHEVQDRRDVVFKHCRLCGGRLVEGANWTALLGAHCCLVCLRTRTSELLYLKQRDREVGLLLNRAANRLVVLRALVLAKNPIDVLADYASIGQLHEADLQSILLDLLRSNGVYCTDEFTVPGCEGQYRVDIVIPDQFLALELKNRVYSPRMQRDAAEQAQRYREALRSMDRRWNVVLVCGDGSIPSSTSAYDICRSAIGSRSFNHTQLE